MATDGDHAELLATATDAGNGGRLDTDVMFAAMEASPTPMVVSDPRQDDNPIVFANRAFCDLSGYDAEELIGRNCRFLQGPGTDPADARAIREAVAGRRGIVRDLLNYRRDGTGFVNELHISPIFDADGELAYFLGSQVDLTRYRRDWSRLQVSEERYRSLFDAVDAGFCVIEMRYDEADSPVDYRFVEVNRAFEDQTGIVEAVGRWMREIAPGHEQHWFDLYGKVDRERRSVRFENEALALGRFYDVHAYPVGSPDQHQVAILFNDVTPRRRAERDLAALNADLERQVAERTRELTEASEALRQAQKMEAIGQLTGGVAHDFNNLLTIIRSAGEFLRRPELPADKRERYVSAIVETADRAAGLTGQLLAFARRQPLKAETFDVCERVATVMELVRTLIGPEIELRVDRGAGPAVALADPNQFDTALVNLAVNARDAMEGGGVLRFAVSAVDGLPPLRHHEARRGSFIAVEVADTGSGIAAGDLNRIFEPFFTTKSVGKGTGLGLSQVFGFAKQSNGDVEVDSSPGGTRFVLYLPAAAEGRVDSGDGSAIGIDPGKRDACILVVEDNAEVGRFSTELLHDIGFRTAWVPDAATALERLGVADGSFDLVFSDVMMPGMSGIDLAREIGRLYPSLPVVLTTGYSSALADEGTRGLPLVRKPYSLETLSAVIAGALKTPVARD